MRTLWLLLATTTACAGGVDTGDLDDVSAPVGETSTPGKAVWTRQWVGATSVIRDLATDPDGASIVVGYYRDWLELGATRFTQPDEGYIIKYSPTGTREWTRILGVDDAPEEIQEVYKVATDASGDILVIGEATQGIDYGCGKELLVSIARLSTDGKCLWSHELGTQLEEGEFASAQLVISALEVDVNGDILLAGSFKDQIVFPGGATLTASGSDQRRFLAKLGADGRHMWSRELGGESLSGVALGVDGWGNITLAGDFYGTIDLGTGPQTTSLQSLYVARFGPRGDVRWVRRFGDNVSGRISLDVAPNGTFVVGGHFKGTIDFGRTARTTTGTNYDVFLTKFNSDGTDRWSKHVTGTADMWVSGVALDHRGNVDALLGAGPATSYSGTTGDSVLTSGSFGLGSYRWESLGTDNMFLAKISPNEGSVLWAKRYGDDDSPVYGEHLTVTPTARILVAGEFINEVDFGRGPVVSEYGYSDFFLTRFYQ
jgi:hypothetical protein